jgi:predicted metalloprotease
MMARKRLVGRALLVVLSVAAATAVGPFSPVATTAARGQAQATPGGLRHPILDGALPPSAHADKLFKMCLEAAGYDGQPILFLSSQSELVQNACATYVKGEHLAAATPAGSPPGPAAVPVVLYNPTFMTQMSFAAGNEYVCVYILAHEVGHIVKGHVNPGRPLENLRPPWDQELEADQFAGKVLAKLGAKPTELAAAHRVMVANQWIRVGQRNGRRVTEFADKTMRVGSLITGSNTHPDALRRIQAVARGWKEGGGDGDVEADLTDIFTKLVRQLSRWEPGA